MQLWAGGSGGSRAARGLVEGAGLAREEGVAPPWRGWTWIWTPSWCRSSAVWEPPTRTCSLANFSGSLAFSSARLAAPSSWTWRTGTPLGGVGRDGTRVTGSWRSGEGGCPPREGRVGEVGNSLCQAQLVLPSPSLPTREVTPLMERGREFVHGLNPVRWGVMSGGAALSDVNNPVMWRFFTCRTSHTGAVTLSPTRRRVRPSSYRSGFLH